MTQAAPGVLRRAREDVPFSPRPISVLRPSHEHGVFVVDAVFEAYREVDERKHLANRLRSR